MRARLGQWAKGDRAGLLLPLVLVAAGCAPRDASSPGDEVDARPAAPVDLVAPTRVVLLGTGTPVPDPERAGPAVAIVVGDRVYRVDAGA
ncbi:MAG TPA: hypothetical protein VMV46_00940, partial [Thermoanaerobaculia bacterium]|nr:hypothetical protein [Thermoanaerobaculia bacterium]